MIRISHLEKIYKSKKRKMCWALNKINLVLPDSGLVFILGKSGSGKSTLLNLIGGLDNLTAGSIEVDGNNLANFKENDFCNYRNTHIGFIFQDYHLIDDLTVYDNIALSLNLLKIEDRELILQALARVDLAGYEDRYPSELSGGEQQRVAIARAIIKKPKIILADEPTGNLDTYTASAIVSLLKDLSKECLILIVSHNVNDANVYADRIIELKSGCVISDKSRNPEFLDEVSLANDELIYPAGLALSDSDIVLINKNLHKKFTKKNDKFISTNEPKDKVKKVEIKNKNLDFAKTMSLSGKFLKSKTPAICFSAFMVAVIMVIMALAQTFISFDGHAIVADEMNNANQSSILIIKLMDEETKALADSNFRVKIDDSDIQKLYDAGYNGDVYPVYNVSLKIKTANNFLGFRGAYLGADSYFIKETLGTIVVDEDFLLEKFGSVDYIAECSEFDPAGVIITDYVADALIAASGNKYKSYEDIVEKYSADSDGVIWRTINAVINTGYKERYAELLAKISTGQLSMGSEVQKDGDFNKLVNEIYTSLGYTYSLNENFAQDYSNEISKRIMFRQRLVINNTVEFVRDDIMQYYLTWGKTTANVIYAGWRYTTTAPEIPTNAKYMKVAYGDSSNVLGTDLYYDLPVSRENCAHVVFSNGYKLSKSELEHSGYSWLKADDGMLSYQSDRPTSYVSDYIEIPENSTISEFCTLAASGNAFCAFYDENMKFISSYSTNSYVDIGTNSITMTYANYNRIFGTNYTEANYTDFVPHTIKLSHYAFADVQHQTPLIDQEVTIRALTTGGVYWQISSDLAHLFAEQQVYPSALYLDGMDGIGKVLDIVGDLNYETQSLTADGVHTMTRVVDIFVPIFELIAIFLCLSVVLVLVNFSSKMINDKMHEIGVLKALGTKNSSIGVIFGLQVGLIAVLTCILATVGYYLFIGIANDILIESLHTFAKQWVGLDVEFLKYQPSIALLNCGLAIALATVSMIFPMVKIKSIKPVKIIKAKE